MTSRVAVLRASGRSCTPARGRCPLASALQRLHPAVSPWPPARGRCPPDQCTTATPPGGESSAARQGSLFPREPPPRPRPRGRLSSAAREGSGSTLRDRGAGAGVFPDGRDLRPGGGCSATRQAQRASGQPAGRALSGRARHTLRLSPSLRKRQLRGAGAASRHLPRPPRRRPAPQPRRRRRGAPRLPASPAGGSVPPPPSPGMNIMDFNVKKLAADAGTFLSRAVQVRRRRLRTGRWRRGG